ncbi:MAG: nucleoside-diphosphate sugar epimerase/dehydratase [Peptostreptococcus anaerobius]
MNSKLINVMIVGAGEAGQILVREIDNNRSKINRRVVVLVDDNKDIIGKDLLGIPVRGE